MSELDGCLTTDEAQAWIDAAEHLGFSPQGSGGAAAGEAFRDHSRLLVRDPSAARQLWVRTGLRALFLSGGAGGGPILVDGRQPLGLSGNLRLYRYAGGGKERFGKHVDGADEDAEVEVQEEGAGAVVATRRGVTGYTVLFYLSGGGPAAGGGQQQQQQREVVPRASQRLVGGETKFWDHRRRLVASVAPVAGRCLVHLHGYDRCLEHEAAAVESGCKYVLRSDVVFGPAPEEAAKGAAVAEARGGGGKRQQQQGGCRRR